MAPNPWLDRRVLCYAHQGGAKEGPSSTLAALSQAIEAGATAIELDVHATSDRQLVVCHDHTLERTTNAEGEISSHTLAELLDLDNAYWYVPGEDAVPGRPDADYPLRGRAPADHSYGIATLADVLSLFEGIPLNFDIKRTAPEVEPYEDLLAAALLGAGRSDDVIVASFIDSATDSFRVLAPQIGTSPGITGVAEFTRAVKAEVDPPDSIRRHVTLQVPAYFGDMEIVDRHFVEVAHEYGLAVHVWTIDEAEEMSRLLELGVDGIMTDRPSVLAKVLAGAGATWQPA